MEPEVVSHRIAPVFDARSRVLVLGTMPSPASRARGFYYGHPQNRFWKVLGALFDEPEPLGTDARKAFLLAHGIALWDVLASCEIVGASDASISRAVPNDLRLIADAARIEAVFTTGAKGGLPLSPPVCGHAARRGARVAALHQSGERPHAPRRPRGGLPPAQGGHHGAVRSRKGEVMKTRPGACRRLTAVSA